MARILQRWDDTVKPISRAFRKTIVFFSKVTIVAATVTLFVLTLFRYYDPALFYFKGNIVLTLLYSLILLVIGITYGAYRVGILRLRELIFSYLLALVITNTIFYFILSLLAKYMVNLWHLIVLTLLQAVVSVGLYFISNRVYFSLHPPRKCVVILRGHVHDFEIVNKFRNIRERFAIGQVLQQSRPHEELCEAIDNHQGVILCGVDARLKTKLIDYCFQKDKRLFVVPDFEDITLNSADVVQIDDTLALLVKNRGMTTEQRVIKRVMDILVSLVGVIIASPLMLICAACIKLQDRGPVLYRQKRLTLDHREFMLIKFRSMTVDAEKNGARLATQNDARVTKFGKFMRTTRLDEIPQLLNILKGDMSLVGPRPERPEIMEKICQTMPEFCQRLKVKAGLTGYAQVYGRYDTSFEDKVKMDLLYIQNYSLMLDFQLLFATIKVLFVKNSARGVKDTKKRQKTASEAEEPAAHTPVHKRWPGNIL